MSPASLIESFRFEDVNQHEYQIKLNVFVRVLRKDTQESFILLVSPKKLVRLFVLKVVKPSPDGKMIKLLTCDNLLPPLRHSR